jgi:competence ComEA-like helix-hairpin-helix protein
VKHSPLPANPEASTRFLLVIGLALFVSACATVTRVSPGTVQSQLVESHSVPAQVININTASAAELETLPGIGKATAERIIAHRERYGPFRRVEHLLMVRGISDGKFRALRPMIVV